mmetsp:Transcript_10350/g.42857  ORF Transcript_10350/g.42857 Transcript_10350/m.42857 type:complete len:211 (+) Transcript_10350:1383-2015(+)
MTSTRLVNHFAASASICDMRLLTDASCSSSSASSFLLFSTTSAGAFSTNLGDLSLPASPSTSFSNLPACLPSLESSFAGSTIPDSGRYTSTPSLTTVCTKSPGVSTAAAGAAAHTCDASASSLARPLTIANSAATSSMSVASETTTNAGILFAGSTAYSARALRMDRTMPCTVSNAPTAPASLSASSFGQLWFMMESPRCGSDLHTSSVT